MHPAISEPEVTGTHKEEYASMLLRRCIPRPSPDGLTSKLSVVDPKRPTLLYEHSKLNGQHASMAAAMIDKRADQT